MMKVSWKKYVLDFKRPSGTSRGVLRQKASWFFIGQADGQTYYGECGLLQGLSMDDVPEYETKLTEVCNNIERYQYWLEEGLVDFPSIRFGLEMLFKAYQQQSQFELFPSAFTKKETPIPINGLVWMGEKSFMKQQIKDKIADGFNCIKLKIGAIQFEDEIALLQYIRSEFSAKDIEIRVDANGAFATTDALEKLKRLSDFELHSIEQPIKQGQWDEMAKLCAITPLDIALDEELIGVNQIEQKQKLVETIQPQYLIFKPSLIGGFKSTEEWISIIKDTPTNWWATSALESNIGLNAIAQWTFVQDTDMHQGLGTGQLYTNNFDAPLVVKKGHIHYSQSKHWNITL